VRRLKAQGAQRLGGVGKKAERPKSGKAQRLRAQRLGGVVGRLGLVQSGVLDLRVASTRIERAVAADFSL
jgi:hypothetical protein